MHSLTGNAFEFYSYFISYSTKDQEFAERLYADFQTQGVRCWFAPHDMQGGKILYEQIDTAIRLHERVLLILSPSSIHSKWVEIEIVKARKRERAEGTDGKEKRVLFPVLSGIAFAELRAWECMDPDSGEDLARTVRSFFIPDFTNWKKHDSYREEFKKLLRDLKNPDPES